MGEGSVTTQPRAQSYIIKRPRLTKLLDESGARIILLCAPAGYGKTTLAREWVSTRSEPVAWYSGGIEMLDAAALAAGLGHSLRRIGLPEDAYERLVSLASQTPKGTLLGAALLEALPTNVERLLVIDDYHHADGSSESEAIIATLAKHDNLQVLLTSRVRPSWLTSRMS